MPKRALIVGGAPAARAPLPQPTPAGVTTTLSGKFQARIKIKGKRYDLGSYDTVEEAMDAFGALAPADQEQLLLSLACEQFLYIVRIAGLDRSAYRGPRPLVHFRRRARDPRI